MRNVGHCNSESIFETLNFIHLLLFVPALSIALKKAVSVSVIDNVCDKKLAVKERKQKWACILMVSLTCNFGKISNNKSK